MKSPLLLFAILVVSSGLFASESQTPPITLPSHTTIIGKVGDQTITLKDIESKEINKLRQDLYDQMLTALQAKAAELLKQKDERYHQPQAISISDQDIERFYYGNQLQRRGTLEQLKPQIKSYLEQAVQAQMNQQIFAMAQDRGDLSNFLNEPEAFTVTIPVDAAYMRGNAEAETMLMEFSDYQCPFCSRIQSTISKLIDSYGDQAAFGYRHFPLDFHKEADDAAIAVECAREQNKFEAMHSRLFQQQSQQSRDDLKALAKDVGVEDMEAFTQCLDDNRYADRVEQDMKVGQSIGITGTPGFVIGRYNKEDGTLTGEIISGAQPEAVFTETLKKYLPN